MDEPPPLERAMSTDVIMDIVLSQLKTRDLLNCREVSKFWNKAASSVLRKRSTMIKRISTTKSLMELEQCMKQNSDFPFAGFKFGQSWMLNSPRAKEFFKSYGPRFTSLCLSTSMKTTIQDLAQFVNHLPGLSTLEVENAWDRDPPPPTELLDSAAGQEGGQILLQSLRTLKISSEMNKDLLHQVLRAASSPKLQIEVNAKHGILSAVKSSGRLQAVSVLEVREFGHGMGELALLVDELLSTETLVLTKLNFQAGGCISRNQLMKLIISSQHTLKELDLCGGIFPSEFASECSVLTKLTKLSLDVFGGTDEYVFQGRQGHKFPALKDLTISTIFREADGSKVNISDGLFVVPSLETIDLYGFVDKDEIIGLARCFPNVSGIRLYHRDDPSDIWSVGAFKFLEKLTIRCYPVKMPSNDYMNMDRFLTGMPTAVCNILRKHAQQNLVDSPFNEILRESPSILQLKKLKELIVCVELKCELKEFPEEPPFISMVSLWYALDMMPNLEARFVYSRDSPSWNFEEKDKDKAVSLLKAAFKHVQPYVELKRSLY